MTKAQENEAKIYDENDQPKKDKLIISLVTALSLTFNFALFSPIEIYFNNIGDFTIVPYQQVLIVCLPVAAVMFLLLFSAMRLTKGKAHIITAAVITGTDLALYIQGNYLTLGMHTLDGTSYSVSPVRAVLDIAMWAAIIFLPVLIHLKLKKYFKTFVILISAMIIAVELVGLIFSFSVSSEDIPSDYTGTILSLNTKDEFTYSSDKNLIIILTDQYDSFAFDKAVETEPESVSGFGGFTYYNNTIGMYGFTKQGTANILTGKHQRDPDKKVLYSGDVFFNHIPEEYKVELYADRDFFPRSLYEEYADNSEENELSIKDHLCVCSVLYKMALYRTMPDAVKGAFWIYSGDISNNLTTQKTYLSDNLSFYDSLPEKIQTTDEPCFKFIYLLGIHDPRTVNKDLDRVDPHKEKLSAAESGIAVNKILSAYFDVLREGGVYDNSDIIVLADHGHRPNYSAKYPLLMIKRAGDPDDGFKTSSAPISYDDLFPTECYLAGDESMKGKTVFDIPEGEERERYYAAQDIYITEDVDRTLPFIEDEDG